MTIELWIVILTAIAAFTVGSLSVVVLWCIHVKTYPRPTMATNEPQSTDSQPTAQCKLMAETPTTLT